MTKLPEPRALSSAAITFLNDRVRTREDLYSNTAATLSSELQLGFLDLEQAVSAIASRLESCLLSYYSSSDSVNSSFDGLRSSLARLSSCAPSPRDREKKTLGEELPQLASDVARVETVREYAEKTLKLAMLVGEIEDSLSSIISKKVTKHSKMESSADSKQIAINALGLAEDELVLISKARPQWKQLVLAVDQRIDRAIAILRPQAIAEHRNLLASLRWPPPLTALTASVYDAAKSGELFSSLSTKDDSLGQQYYLNFLALCKLQDILIRRKSRQISSYSMAYAPPQPLWTIEELVNPLFISCQPKFLLWNDKPEFIFLIVYKISRDFAGIMDEKLQPIVDEARLLGYSCREEWVSSMTTSLSSYLAKEVFPRYVGEVAEGEHSGMRAQANEHFLRLIDLMIDFDKQMQSLVSEYSVGFSLQDDGNMQKFSSFSIFCDRHDWLDFWAKIEADDALEKLNPVISDEKNWNAKANPGKLVSEAEAFSSPAVSGECLRVLFSVFERSKSLPTGSLKSRFLRLVGVPIIRIFLGRVLNRCQEAEGLTALTDDDGLIKVAHSINAAHSFESVLKKWCEDVFFLELKLDDPNNQKTNATSNLLDEMGGAVFGKEIEELEKFRDEWVEKLSLVIMRGFDARTREYTKNRKQWQGQSGENWPLSASLVEALVYLQGKMSVIKENLNARDFVTLWRTLAGSADRLLFSGIFASNPKFDAGGAARLCNDMNALFGIFGAWCLRPESFFPKLRDATKLLISSDNVPPGSLSDVGKRIKEKKISHLTIAEVEKVLQCRASHHLTP